MAPAPNGLPEDATKPRPAISLGMPVSVRDTIGFRCSERASAITTRLRSTRHGERLALPIVDRYRPPEFRNLDEIA
jgi:hypothetical protein